MATIIFVFSVWAQCQTLSVIHAFQGPPSDGANPFAGLVGDGAGNWFGAAETGGSSCCGTIFKIDSTGNYSTLYNFTGGSDQGFPSGTLVRDANGNLYGTTQHGERSGSGTVFKFVPGGQFTTLYQFTGGADGNDPFGSLAMDKAGNLYGTTESGGDLSCNGGSGCGVVFKVDPTGKETVLYSFHSTANGEFPSAGVVLDAAGNIYGTTPVGGNANCNAPFGCGVVFKLTRKGKEIVLHKFKGGADGAFPESGLIRDSAGYLYGTTSEGAGSGCMGIGCGVVFKIRGTRITQLYVFQGSPNDGSYPSANLYRDAAGNLFGTTRYGGSSACQPLGCGAAFELDSTGKEVMVYSFNYQSDGGAPLAPLVPDGAGNFLGTTSDWGPSNCNQYGCGTVFKLTP